MTDHSRRMVLGPLHPSPFFHERAVAVTDAVRTGTSLPEPPPLPRGEALGAAQPLVSVLVPWYHGERWAAQLEATLAAQTWRHWEAIVVADGCPPPSFADPRIRVFAQESNAGISATTNAAYAVSSGSFVTLLDQDDRLDPACLEVLLLRLFEHPEWAGVSAMQVYCWPGQEIVECHPPFSRQQELSVHAVGHPVMIRRAAWVPHATGTEPSQDTDWALRVTDRAYVGFEDRPLYYWTLHHDNESLVHGDRQRAQYMAACARTKARRVKTPNVCFSLPGLDTSGGVRVVLELANELRGQGWGVAIDDITGEWGQPLARSEGRAYDVTPPPKRPPMIALADGIGVWQGIPPTADLAIATSWDASVDRCLEHAWRGDGTCGWLLQDWEAGWGPHHHATNPGITHSLTTASWVRDRLLREWAWDVPWLPYGTTYAVTGPRPLPAAPSVVMAWRDHPRKAPARTLALARMVKAAGYPLCLLCKDGPPPGAEDLADSILVGASEEEVFARFRTSAFFLTCSQQEGHFLMALEAASQGCVPICQARGTEYFLPGAGARVTPAQPLGAYVGLLRVLWPVWDRRSEACRAMAAAYTWEAVLPRWQETFRSWLREDYAGIRNCHESEGG